VIHALILLAAIACFVVSALELPPRTYQIVLGIGLALFAAFLPFLP
jgi:hypothetical protein